MANHVYGVQVTLVVIYKICQRVNILMNSTIKICTFYINIPKVFFDTHLEHFLEDDAIFDVAICPCIHSCTAWLQTEMILSKSFKCVM